MEASENGIGLPAWSTEIKIKSSKPKGKKEVPLFTIER